MIACRPAARDRDFCSETDRVNVRCFSNRYRCFTYLNIIHSLVTFYLFHWNKGSPVQADQVRCVLCSPFVSVRSTQRYRLGD